MDGSSKRFLSTLGADCWRLYADLAVAPLRRSQLGAFMPIRHWRHYADHQVAPICRSRFGAITAIGDNATERTTRDLGSGVVAPTLYAFEAIPSALHPEQIRDVLTWTRRDRSPKGLRDYAILMLLSTYGLRAGEIVQLRLEDLDWRADRLWVCHTKTGSRSALPLVPDVGEAILEYLRRGRPIADAREIFIHTRAPYIPFKRGSSLYPSVRSRLEAAGVNPTGKRGPHAFRHAHAVRLLRASVTVKTIGDLLGHRSAASTTPYLKLATADLRAVALEIPGQEVQA